MSTTTRLHRNVRKDEFEHGPIVGDAPAPGILHPAFEGKPYVQQTPL